jgi:hypothetical protein
LASAYGWDKNTILAQVYPDELDFYLKRIQRDQANRDLTMLAIVHNPHVKHPQKLIQELEKRVSQLEGNYWAVERIDGENARKLMEVRKVMQENARKRRG